MKKIFVYSMLGIGLFGLLGVGVASADGLWGYGRMSAEDMSQRFEEMTREKSGMLGVSPEQYKQSWAEGKNFREMAEEQGISQEEIRQRMQETRQVRMEQRLQALVEEGVISQEQAQERINYMQEHMGQRAGDGRGGRFKGHGGDCPMID